jgi:hypothetical protein
MALNPLNALNNLASLGVGQAQRFGPTAGPSALGADQNFGQLSGAVNLWMAFQQQLRASGLSPDKPMTDDQWKAQVDKFFGETMDKAANGEFGLDAQQLAEQIIAKRTDEDSKQAIEQTKNDNQSKKGCGGAAGGLLGAVAGMIPGIGPLLKPIIEAVSGGQSGGLGSFFAPAQSAANLALRQDLQG